VLKVLCLY